MTDSYILEKVFRTLTGLKFEALFLSSDCLSLGEQMQSLHCQKRLHYKKTSLLLFMASANGRESTPTDILTSFGRILSVPVAFLSSIFLRSL